MIIFAKADGTIVSVTPETITAGTLGLTRVTFIAPIAATNTVAIGFTLPDGRNLNPYPAYSRDIVITDNRPDVGDESKIYYDHGFNQWYIWEWDAENEEYAYVTMTPPKYMSPLANGTGIDGLNAWTFDVDFPIEQNGVLTLYIIAIEVNTRAVKTFTPVNVTVNPSEEFIPVEYDESNWNSILEALSRAREAADRAEEAAQTMDITEQTQTTITGILKGSGGHIAQAVEGSDYTLISRDAGGLFITY